MVADKSDLTARQGGCLCGAVRFKASLHGAHYHVCHCVKCRGWSGGPGMAVPAGSVTVTTPQNSIRAYSSSKHGERIFCGDCGSHLFWQMKDQTNFAVFVGALDDSDDLTFENEIFFDSKPNHYSFSNGSAKLTGEMVRTLFLARVG